MTIITCDVCKNKIDLEAVIFKLTLSKNTDFNDDVLDICEACAVTVIEEIKVMRNG